MNNDIDPLPLSPAVRPLFNLVGIVVFGLGLAGFWVVFERGFASDAMVILGASMGCCGLGAELLHAGITGRKFGASGWWLP
jgi:hypothetical protein